MKILYKMHETERRDDIGGGQLGRMLAQSAKRIWDSPSGFWIRRKLPGSPVQLAHQAAYADAVALRELAEESDRDIQFENIDAVALQEVETLSSIPQRQPDLRRSRRTAHQEDFLQSAGVSCAIRGSGKCGTVDAAIAKIRLSGV